MAPDPVWDCRGGTWQSDKKTGSRQEVIHQDEWYLFFLKAQYQCFCTFCQLKASVD